MTEQHGDDRELKIDPMEMDLQVSPDIKDTPSPWKDTPWNREDVHYLMLPRTSPYNLLWLTQIFTLLYACVFRIFIWGMHPGCNVTVNRCVYLSKGQSRHEMNKSDAIIALLLTIMAIPLEHKVIIAVTDVDRLGVVLRNSMALAQIFLYRPNLEIVSVSQHGISVVTSLENAALQNETKKETGQTSTSKNSSKGIAPRKTDIDKIETIEEAWLDFKQSLSDEDSEENKLVKDAKSAGDELEAEIPASVLDDLSKELAEKVSQVESGEMTSSAAVEALQSSFLLTVPNRPESVPQGASLDIVFTRSSRGTKAQTTHGVLTNQGSRCFAAKGYHDSEAKTKTPACVIHANANRDEITRNKLAMLLVLVFHGVVDTLYLSTLVRLSSSVSVIKIFLAAFEKFDVSLVAVDCIGKDLMRVAEAEVSRLLKLSIATQEKNDAEDAERDKLSPLEQLRSRIMKAIARCKFGDHLQLTENVTRDEDTKTSAKKRKKALNASESFGDACGNEIERAPAKKKRQDDSDSDADIQYTETQLSKAPAPEQATVSRRSSRARSTTKKPEYNYDDDDDDDFVEEPPATVDVCESEKGEGLSAEQQWVGCDSCGKWRKLPVGTSPDTLPGEWQCNMNTWDKYFATCEAAEEVWA